MRKFRPLLLLSAMGLMLVAATAHGQKVRRPNNPPVKPVFSRPVYTIQGIAVLGYAPSTPVRIVGRTDGAVVWSGTIGNRSITTIPLPHGHYVVQAPDEFRLISQNIVKADLAGPRPKRTELPRTTLRPLAAGGPLTIQPVPWVADSTYASHPPSLLSRHTVFSDIPTVLKAVVQGGTPPYTVDWDPGDGSPIISTPGVMDGYNGAAASHTYTLPVGTPITATITVTDSAAAVAVGYYYIIVGNPTIRSNRIARSTDEALWYLHTQIVRTDGYATGGHPAADVGYIENYGLGGGYYTIGSSAMAAVCFSNTGRAITGGKNLSNDPAKDAYVEDLNRLINWLTDSGNLYDAGISTKTYATFGPFNPDTHGPGGVPNGIGLRSSGAPIYEGGMQLQAISQAGNTEAPVPNRSDYASYYDLIGDFVDGMQYAQSESGWSEGGARYYAFPADSDGSAVGWYAIGLSAAQQAHLNTPHPGPAYPMIDTDAIFKAALNLWLTTNWHPTVAETVGGTDYRTGAARTYHMYGGQDYEPFYQYDNAAKTGGGLVALHHVGAPITDPRVEGAFSYLYRWFFSPDYQMGWSSARDAYGMYNIFKGLNAYGVGTLTDPMGGPLVDFDGEANWSGQWFDVLADFIVGAAPTAPGPPTDLGHQSWPGNLTLTSPAFSAAPDGHYEPIGTRGVVAPLTLPEWWMGASDYNSSINLVTPWDVLVCQSTVFTPPPVAVISRPSDPAGETYVPDQVGGVDYYATFDPGGNGLAPDHRFGSYHLDSSRYIKKVRWDWGDGTPFTEYDLPFPGALGSYVPTAPGVYPAGNQAVHHFSLGPGGTPIDRTVTLTVWDDAGQQSSTTVVIHVIPAPYPPVAVMSFQAQGASNQDGDTVGVLPDGTVQIKFTGTASYNPDPASVLTPKNALGISEFWWEWPANAVPYNTGLSEAPPLFDQGTSSGDPNLNPGSKDGVQTYTFAFNPASFPSAIIVGLRVKSNIVAVGVPDTATIYKTINLKDNASVTPSAVQIKNVSVHDITETSAVLSFDTQNAGGAPQLTKAKIDYGLTSAYGTTTPLTPAFQTHHSITLTGLAANKTYHFKITATTSGGVSGFTSDATFTTLAAATPILRFRVLSRSNVPGYELVTYRVTNVGAGIALNLAFSAFTANRGVTLDSILTPLPTTIPASGGFADFTVKWALPTPTPANFTSKFTCIFENSGAPPTVYSNTPSLLVFVP
jgi:hypothetical protein